MAFVDGEVYFVGAFISGTGGGFWNLYLDGTLVHTSTVLAPSNDFGPVFLPSGWTGLVDRVEWVAHPGWTTLDDVTYSTVPEPATMTLIAIGAAGLAATHRRRKQA
ncbi:MAG: PEP-CTERM sorting domain-containing protein [Gemmatimonadales bacterium]